MKEQKIKTKNDKLGSVYIILSAVLFGMMPMLAKIAYAHGSNAYSVAFGRFFFGSILLFWVILMLPNCSIKIERKLILELFKLSIPYGLTSIFLFASYDFIDSGMATTLHFTYPVAVIVIMALFCKAALDFKQLVCAALCMGGILLLYTPGGQMSVQGILLAVVSGIAYAVYIVLLGRSPAKALHPLVLSFWLALFSAMIIGAIALLGGNLTFHMEYPAWIAEISIGLLTTVLGGVLFQQGVFLCGEIKSSLLSTFEPLTGLFLGVVVFHELLSGRELIGIGSILMSTVLLVVPFRRKFVITKEK